jgi:hypothetical protein
VDIFDVDLLLSRVVDMPERSPKKKKKVEMRKWPAVCIELFAYWTLERHRHISSSSL